jgi:[acyl-carrier-protein] S-malonyltransferase
MGSALAKTSERAREVFERADEALGFAISKLCFEGPDGELALTKFTQPAILTTSIAALEALRERYPELPTPAFVAGHSLGEYSALVAASAISLEDAVRLVFLRGQAMQEAVPAGLGGMAAIMGGDHLKVEDLCRDAADGQALSPANYNAPGQIVIAGEAEAIGRAIVMAKERSLKAIPLKVSAPFHCSLMAPAAERVRRALESVEVLAPKIPVVANVNAEPNQNASLIPNLLVKQVDSPVLWDRSVEFLAKAGVTSALELGSGKVLAGLVKRIDKSISVHSVGEPGDLDSAAECFH